MHWIRSYFNYGWQTKKWYQTGVSAFKTSPGSGCFLSWLLSSWPSGRVEERLLLWQTPQATKSDGGFTEGRPTGKDLFWLPKGHPRSWEKEDSMELHQGPRTQATDAHSKPWATSLFPMRKLKGNQPILKMPILCLAHLEEEDTSGNEDQESDNPSRIEGVMEESMVCLARAIKDAQADEKHCYHCSSPEHFIHNCPLMKTLREKKQLNAKEGLAMKKGAWTPLTTANASKSPRQRFLRCKDPQTDSLLESGLLSALAWDQKCS